MKAWHLSQPHFTGLALEAKIKIGVAKGKKHDKRTDMKEKDWARDKARIMKSNLV